MLKETIKHFSINQICDSGQCFRMKELDFGEFEVIAKGKYLKVSQSGDEVLFKCNNDDYENIWKEYFDIDTQTDYDQIIKSIDRDDLYLKNAAKYGDGSNL